MARTQRRVRRLDTIWECYDVSFSFYSVALYAAKRFNFEPAFEFYGLRSRLTEISEPELVPAAFAWGMIVMAMLLLAAGTLVLLRRGTLETRF